MQGRLWFVRRSGRARIRRARQRCRTPTCPPAWWCRWMPRGPTALARAGASGSRRSLRWFGQAVHCHLVRSHSAFAIVADGFNRTSFHGFLAKRLLLRGGRLLKHIGVAPVVAAPEISGCGFPAKVAVNALVVAVEFSGHVFRVFIRNVGHRFSFVSCRREFS